MFTLKPTLIVQALVRMNSAASVIHLRNTKMSQQFQPTIEDNYSISTI